MNAPRCTPDNSIDFLIASPGPVSCTEAARVQPASPFSPAHDSFTRLLNRLEPDPETLWQEAEPLVETNKGVLVLDDSTNDKPYAKHFGLVTRHWSGKHKKPVRGINLITLLWTDGDRKIPCDYRLYSKADGKTKNWDLISAPLPFPPGTRRVAVEPDVQRRGSDGVHQGVRPGVRAPLRP